MRSIYMFGFILVLLTLSTVATAMTVRQPLADSDNGCGQHFNMECNRCHGESIRTAEGTVNLTADVNQVCMECHQEGLADNEMAAMEVVNSRGQVKKIVFSHQMSHPTEIDYARRALANSRMRPVDRLDKHIRLINGEVGCLSCHNPASPEPAFLIGSYAEGDFCRKCHQNY